MPKKLQLPDKLRLITVDFNFKDLRTGEVSVIVRFCHDTAGKPEIISIFTPPNEDVAYVQDNRDGRWKPCVTHATEILRRLTLKPAKSEHAKQRARASKPELKLFAAGA